MFNFVHVKIVVFFDLLLVADMNRAMEFKVKPLENGTSGKIPCSHIENDSEVRLVQWYKSRNTDTFVNGDPSLASWVDGATRSLPKYYMENATFSLVIENTTLEDEGLYRCSVISGDKSTRYTYYIRSFIYALPRKDPKITWNTHLKRVTCTVENVRPVVYPVFDFDSIPETYAVPNKDGTYTTSVSCTLPQTKNGSGVECSFSYQNYKRVGLFVLPDITTDNPMENKTTTVSPMGTYVTFAGDGCRPTDQKPIIVAGIIIFFLAVIIIVMLIMLIRIWSLRRIWIRDVQNCNKAEESEENMISTAMPV